MAGSIIKGIFGGGGAAKSAAEAQAGGAMQSAQLQREMFEQIREDLAPYRKVGPSALEQYTQAVLGGDMSRFFTSPGYQFRMQEGQKALESGAAARGNLFSGATGKALTRYGQGLASQEYQNYLNRLADITDIGQSAATQTGRAGQQAAALQGSALQQAGTAQAQGILGKQQAQAGLAGNVLGAIGGVSAMGGIPGLLGAVGSFFSSDERLKENIEKVGEENGYNIYEFDFINKPGRYRGVMAQEVLETQPDAVGEYNGYMTVNYRKIGIKGERIA